MPVECQLLANHLVSSIIAELLEHALHVDDYLVRQQIAIGVNRSVVIVPLIIGIVSPGRIRISRIPIIVSASDEHDDDIVLLPPIAVMPFMPVAPHRVRRTVAIVFGSFSVPHVVINCVTIPITVNGWFPMAGIVGDSYITASIVICRCGLCRLNPWLRQGRVPVVLGFEVCCVAVVWLGDVC